MYKCISYELKDRQVDAQKVMFKVPTVPPEVAAYEEPVDLDELVGDTTLAKLNDIFKSIMQKKQDRIDPVRSKFGRIEKEQVSLEDTMHTLEEYARTHRSFSFKNLLESKKRENGNYRKFSCNLRIDEIRQDFDFTGAYF